MTPRIRAVHRGRFFALGAALCFGSVAPLAGFAYQAGASPGTVVVTRLLFGVIAAAGAVFLLNRPWRMPRGEWLATALVAVAWLAVTVGYMASFFYIPVSLAVLIFFTFPVLIAMIGPLIARRTPDPIIFGAALLAFAGLAMALGPDIDGLDWRGCALALLASAGATATFLISERLVVEQDLFAFSFHLHVVCLLAVLVGLAVVGQPDIPAESMGWAGLAGVGIFYTAAMLSNFAAIRLAGPARASVMFNIEPVVAIAGAALLLGEFLRLWQLAGALLVVGALFLSVRADRAEP